MDPGEPEPEEEGGNGGESPPAGGRGGSTPRPPSYADAAAPPAGGEGGTGGSGGAVASPGGWWNKDWAERRAVDVALSVPEPLEAFPLLVELPEDVASADSIRFVDGQGAVMPHEPATSSAGRHAAWVRVARLETGGRFWLYSGNRSAAAPTDDEAARVWGPGTAMWHLDGSGKDSGPGRLTATSDGKAFDEGQWAKAFASKASTGPMPLPMDAEIVSGARAFTISAWVRPDALTATDDKFGETLLFSASVDITNGGDKNLNHAVLSLGLRNGTGHVSVSARPQGDAETATSTKSVRVGEWAFVAGVVDVAKKRGWLYVDGEPASGEVNMGDLEAPEFANPLLSRVAHIGASSGGSYARFNGRIDELKVERVARSAAWLRAAFLNAKRPAEAVSWGPVQTGG